MSATSPVGMFPSGASPSGALDMTGNVLEWTSSRWSKTSTIRLEYSYPCQVDQREDPTGSYLRMMRGGSWSVGARGARAASRLWLAPDDFGGNAGFRVVLSLAFSGF